MDWNLLLFFLSATGAALTTVGAVVWWLASQFRVTRDLIYSRVQEVIEKLEYHEKHDDARFQSLGNEIWEIRVRNAAIDGRKLGRKEWQTGSQDRHLSTHTKLDQ